MDLLDTNTDCEISIQAFVDVLYSSGMRNKTKEYRQVATISLRLIAESGPDSDSLLDFPFRPLPHIPKMDI